MTDIEHLAAACRTAEGIEFLVLTRWVSLDAIRGFAGDDLEQAVVEPAAVAALADVDIRVRHYTLVEESAETVSSLGEQGTFG